nr:hypothetical protein [Tanacetum cinerariifolium]
MTIAEYMEYEAKMKRRYAQSSNCPTRYEGADFNSFCHDKSVAVDYPHYSNNAKIDLYYALPPLLPCFQPAQPHTNYGYESLYEDIKGDMDSIPEYESNMGEQGLNDHTNKTVGE